MHVEEADSRTMGAVTLEAGTVAVKQGGLMGMEGKKALTALTVAVAQTDWVSSGNLLLRPH
jgi:hypothetical protein